MKFNKISQEILHIFPDVIRPVLAHILEHPEITEIRLRVGLPLIIRTLSGEYFVTSRGALSVNDRECIMISAKDIQIIFQKISQYSVFAYREELKEGFITLQGGHRVGLCGKIYYDSEGKRQLSHISSMNLRIARQVIGCSSSFFSQLSDQQTFYHTLLISPPGGGKTTYLRDIIRLISDGYKEFSGQNISVVDERSEIGNRTKNSGGFYLGKRTDLLDQCPKAEGMLMMLRSMGPQVIAADEIGDARDIEALSYIRNCGCQLLMTVHGKNPDDILKRPLLGKYLKEYPFERYVVIQPQKNGRRKISVYGRAREIIWESPEDIL